MITGNGSRTFSTQKHVQGHWDTSISKTSNGLARGLLSYLSYKRKGVDALARAMGAQTPGFVFDAGAGKGAYAHWFLGKKTTTIIAIDWSFDALRGLCAPRQGCIIPVCADLHMLPFKSGVADALYSIDTLGHVDNCAKALDEFLRICKPASLLFIHSECNDYRLRWPDRWLIKRLHKDLLAEYDGHLSLHRSEELYALYSRRFHVKSFVNPAGYFGWLLGYPEKYRMAFAAARFKSMTLITSIFAMLKKLPIIGICVRFVNAFTNHCEVFFGLQGGGSCFAALKTPDQSTQDKIRHPSEIPDGV
jgi:ubiquinone/menaquinone biosynthesis C-methylase UbiE